MRKKDLNSSRGREDLEVFVLVFGRSIWATLPCKLQRMKEKGELGKNLKIPFRETQTQREKGKK